MLLVFRIRNHSVLYLKEMQPRAGATNAEQRKIAESSAAKVVVSTVYAVSDRNFKATDGNRGKSGL